MISGYCISAAAVSSIKRGYPATRFLSRRFYRIYMPYWVCLGFCMLFSLIPGTNLDPGSLTLTQWLGNIFLFENYRNWLMPPPEVKPLLGVSWTLCYEEQFYLATALILFLRRKLLFTIFLLITLFVVVNNYNLNIGPLKALGDLNSFQVKLDGLLVDSFWIFFAVGIGLFCFRSSSSRIRWIFPALLIVFLWWELRQMDWYTNRYATRVTTFVAALALCFVGHRDSVISRWRILQPAKWLGTRSYSIYLVHLPIVTWIGSQQALIGVSDFAGSLALTLPVSMAAAIFTGHYFHMHIERRWIPSPSS
jgi:peptidoglycan/LPS O-acetylase OafA/YrhL